MSFLRVTNEIVDWIINYSNGRIVIEAGAGDMELSKALMKRNVAIIAVDPLSSPDPEFQYLMPVPIHKCSMSKDQEALIVAARPDHSGWFRGIVNYMHPDSELMYIGLTENIELDLDGIEFVLHNDFPGNETAEVCLTMSKQRVFSLYEQCCPF